MSAEPASRRIAWTDVAVVFAAALSFYCATLAPGPIWGDSAWIALQARNRWLEIGTAGDHPLFVLIGHALSFLPIEVARLVNFESAVFAALAVAAIYACARQLGASRLAAAIGAASLCVSHTFWFHAVIAEVYTANAFFLALTLSLLIKWHSTLRRRYLVLAAAALAVGLTNHLVLAAMAPAAIVFVAITAPNRAVNRGVLFAVAGVAIAVAALAIAIPSIRTAIWRLWVGPPAISEYVAIRIDPKPAAREAAYYVLYLLYQFPSVALPLIALGIVALVRRDRRIALLLLLTVAVNAATFIRHTGWQSPGTMKFVFYIPDYVVLSLFCAVGADELLRRRSALGVNVGPWVLAMLAAAAVPPPVFYAIAPRLLAAGKIDIVGASPMPYRDNQRYFLNPNKHGEDGPRRYAREAFEVVAPRAVIFADPTPYTVLRYVQGVDRVRLDVRIARSPFGQPTPVEWRFDDGGRRPMYLARFVPEFYDFRAIAGKYRLVPVGSLIEVQPKQP